MKVFLSHAMADAAQAEDLASRLEAEGFDVWRSDRDLEPGTNWALAIGKALESARAMVVLLSPDSVKSEWVIKEIDFALNSPKYEWRVIPVLLRPTADFPWILEKMQIIKVGKSWDAACRRVSEALHGFAEVAG